MSNSINVIDMGDEIIPFTLESQVGTLNFRDLIDSKWGMLITFDKAFEPVATTELVYNIIIYILYNNNNNNNNNRV